MAWTTPAVFTVGQVLRAVDMNNIGTDLSFLRSYPLFNQVTTAEPRANAAYGALATAGPSITIPAGSIDYIIGTGFHGSTATAAEIALMSYDIGGTGAVDADAVEISTTNATSGQFNDYMAATRFAPKTALSSVTLTAKYRTGGGTWTFKNRWIMAIPVGI